MEATTEINNNPFFIRKPRILLVEDTPLIQMIHVRMLKSINCTVDLAKNGEEALQLYTDSYDLIFMDIGLPDIGGLEVSMRIKQSLQWRHLPIVALTAHSNLDEKECIAAGICEVATKPVATEGLQEILARNLPHLVSLK